MRILQCWAALVILLLILGMLVQSVHASTTVSSPSNWVEVEVRSFDGEGITAAITLSVTGNHENASVRVYGESSAGVGENIPCLTVVCMTSSVGYSVGRIIREVTFSLDTNRTTFHYATRFLSPNYEANTLLGIPPFPIDEHKLNLTITTDFQVDIDGHWNCPSPAPQLPHFNTKLPLESSF